MIISIISLVISAAALICLIILLYSMNKQIDTETNEAEKEEISEEAKKNIQEYKRKMKYIEEFNIDSIKGER